MDGTHSPWDGWSCYSPVPEANAWTVQVDQLGGPGVAPCPATCPERSLTSPLHGFDHRHDARADRLGQSGQSGNEGGQIGVIHLEMSCPIRVHESEAVFFHSESGRASTWLAVVMLVPQIHNRADGLAFDGEIAGL